MTSPVFGSRRTKTSLPSKRNSAGSRTAWLRPVVKSFAVLMRMVVSELGHIIGSVVISIKIATTSMSAPPFASQVVGRLGLHPFRSRRRFFPLPEWRVGLEVVHQIFGAVEGCLAVGGEGHHLHD